MLLYAQVGIELYIFAMVYVKDLSNNAVLCAGGVISDSLLILILCTSDLYLILLYK